MLRKILVPFLLTLCTSSQSAPNEFKIIRGPNVLSGQLTQIEAGLYDGTVVVFLSAICPCSDSHTQELRELYNNYSNFRFIGIHSNGNEGQHLTQEYFKRVKLPFPVIQDVNLEWANRFHALKTPHVFLLNKKGQIVYEGGVSSSRRIETAEKRYLREALVDLSKHQPIRTPMGRTLGCVISRAIGEAWDFTKEK